MMGEYMDDGYISKYLTHWTGRKGEERGAEILSIIAKSCRLLLSYNPISSTGIYDKMACFTDIPYAHCIKHCDRYGRFGIAFKILNLMNCGAQPVFYVSHVYSSDINLIFDFIQEQFKTKTLDEHIFNALLRHFFFMQKFSNEKADRTDTFYYEREWRLGMYSLATDKELRGPNARARLYLNGEIPAPIPGRLVIDGNESFYSFKPEDVAFLIAPEDWISKIEKPNGFEIKSYEELTR